MSDDKTELQELGALVRNSPWGKGHDSMEEKFNELAQRVQYYERLTDELRALANNQGEAQQLYNRIAADESDLESRARKFGSVLFAKGLLTHAQLLTYRDKFQFVSEAQRERNRAAWEEYQAKQKAIQTVLAAVGKPNHQEALGVFNKLGGPMTDDKINAWVRDLVSLKLLPAEWIAGRKLGAVLSQLLHPGGK